MVMITTLLLKAYRAFCVGALIPHTNLNIFIFIISKTEDQ